MKRCASLAAILLLPALFVCAAAATVLPRWKTAPHVPPLPAADTSGIARINGTKLYFAVFNARGNAPVILLHGGLGSSAQWGDEVPLLARTHKVIVMDSRGHGRSELGSRPLSYGLMASDVIGLLDFLKTPKASVVGWSDGGIIGLLLGIHHSQRIDKLFIFGANFNNDYTAPFPPDRSMFARYKAASEATYRRVSPTPNDFPKLLRALGALYAHEPNISPAELATIRAQTIVADGQYEQFIPRKHTEKLARLIPGAKVVIIPDVSHGGPTQDPVRFHKAVIALLDG